MTDSTSRALIAIDFVNEMADPKGKLAGRGYASFFEQHKTLDRVHELLEAARRESLPIFHVRVGFSPDYLEQPEGSPLFGPAKKNKVFQLGTWNTEFHPKAAPLPDEKQIIKHRVSAFYGTPLDLMLRIAGIQEVLICGVATDLAVQSASRDAHDRDYAVTIVSDCCAAASEEDHDQALRLLSKIATVKQFAELGLATL